MHIPSIPRPWPRLRLALAVALSAVLPGCGPARLLDALTPDGEYRRSADIAYGPLARQTLDVYRPAVGDARRTAVVFFYGGGWRSGDKADYRFVAESLTRRGVTVLIADYRVYPEFVFPAFVEDAAHVTAWALDHAAGLGVDPRRVFLMGHSAGAHIAALLALDPRYLGAVGRRPQDLAGVIGIAGPYDFRPMSPRVREVFAAAADRPETQPIAYAGPDAPPVLLVHGADDRTVDPRNSQRLAARLQAAGARVRLSLVAARGHVDIMLGLSSVFLGEGQMMRDIAEFFAAPDVW